MELLGHGSFANVYGITKTTVSKKFKFDDKETDYRSYIKELASVYTLKSSKHVLIPSRIDAPTCIYYPRCICDLSHHRKTSVLSIIQIKRIIHQLLIVLNTSHSMGIIHRDVKPANILIVNDNLDIALIDWGMSIFIPAANNMVDFNVQTIWYRAPEILQRQQQSPKMDIWSVGCILAELVNNKPLFPETVERYQLRKIMKNTSNISNLIDSKDPNLLDLLGRMLCTLPKNRWTAWECLTHPYFDEVRYCSPVCLKYDVISTLIGASPGPIQICRDKSGLISSNRLNKSDFTTAWLMDMYPELDMECLQWICGQVDDTGVTSMSLAQKSLPCYQYVINSSANLYMATEYHFLILILDICMFRQHKYEMAVLILLAYTVYTPNRTIHPFLLAVASMMVAYDRYGYLDTDIGDINKIYLDYESYLQDTKYPKHELKTVMDTLTCIYDANFETLANHRYNISKIVSNFSKVWDRISR